MTVPIVVVDDEEVDRYLVKRVVKSLGIDAKLVEFNDGSDFVEFLNNDSSGAEVIGEPSLPTLVLLDVNMPRMGGFEVLKVMEQLLPPNDQVFFVTMYSSSSNTQDREDAAKYHFVKDYIVKPVTKQNLKIL